MNHKPTAHTPGPWACTPTSHHAHDYRLTQPAAPLTFEGNEVARANARLIAAAPDLLAALKGVLRVADRATDEFDAARAVLAKTY